MTDQLEDRKTELLETLVDLRHEETVRRARLRRIQQRTNDALRRQTIIRSMNQKPVPVIHFTDPPGTGKERMRAIHREMDAYRERKRTTMNTTEKCPACGAAISNQNADCRFS